MPGMVRASLGCYSNESDIDALVEMLERILHGEVRGNYRQDRASGAYHVGEFRPDFSRYFPYTLPITRWNEAALGGIMSSFTYRDRQLWVESVPFQRLAETYGTPLYVYSTRTILDDLRRIEGAFDGLPHLTYYAVKANANRAVLRLIAREGLGADAGSKGELYLALTCGFPSNKITFSGVGKRDDEIAYALEHRILAFYAESTEEISVINQIAGQMGTRAAVLLRVNLDIDAGGHAYVSTSMKHNKFGIPHGDAPEVLRWATGLPHIEVRGIHSHIGSQILRPMTFLRAAEAVANVVGKLRAEGIPVHDLDFGGGFGIQYHGFVTHPELPHEASEAPAISSRVLLQPAIDVLKGLDCSISIQPGRALVAHAGVLLTRVLYRKETATKTFSHRGWCHDGPDPTESVSRTSPDRARCAQPHAP